jgi:hypothetical protein
MIKRILFLFMIVFSHVSVSAGITDLRLSTAQIFDVQWNVSGGKLNTSGFNYIYSSINYTTQTASAARWTQAQTADAASNGRYISFFHSTTNPGTYGMAVYNSDGTIYKLINNTGSFRTLADGAIFYNGNGMWGTLITTKQGFNYGASASFTLTQEYPTNAQLEAYVPDSTTPLAAGQTASPPPPSGPTVTGGTITQTNAPSNQTILSGGSYVSPRTPTEQTRINTWTNSVQSYNNELYIQQTYGSNNNVTITQTGTKNRIDATIGGNGNIVNNTQTGSNYLKEEIPGWGNNVTVNQNTTSSRNYAETKIQGNGNTINHTQTGTGNHILFSNVAGDINTVNSTQSGTAGHALDVKLTGNFNSVISNQTGNTANNANVELTNAGGAATLDLEQTGGKSFTIIQSCVNPAGCSTVVRQ